MVVHSNSPWTGRRWVDVLRDFFPEASDLLCPLSHEIMFDPVIAEDGCTYERLAIERWFESNDTSPMVREAFVNEDGLTMQVFKTISKELQPNAERKAALDRVLRDFTESGGAPFPVEVEAEKVEWDASGLQTLLREPRTLPRRNCQSPQSSAPPIVLRCERSTLLSCARCHRNSRALHSRRTSQARRLAALASRHGGVHTCSAPILANHLCLVPTKAQMLP